ncbi:MAG: AAA family ATPase [Bacteroidota bacterium]
MGEAARLFSNEEVSINSFDPIRDLIREHMETTGKSQRVVAKAIGVSDATLSGFIRGSYAGDMHEVAGKIINYLNRHEARQTVPEEPQFVETSIAKEVFTVTEFAHNHNKIGLIYGDAGVGKTLALTTYAAAHPDVIFVRARVNLKSARAILNEIADKLGKVNVIEALTGTGRLLIIDEAQRLTYSALEALRDIHDECGIGIVFSGNKDIYDRMRGKKGALFAQLFSRVGIRRHLQCRDIVARDIDLVFSQYLQLDKKCKDYLYEIATHVNGGGLRQAKDFYIMGLHIARGQAKDLDLDCLLRAKETLLGPY